MKNPAHPGRMLKDDLDALGLSVAEAAEGLGVSRQQLYNVISGKHAITSEMAVRLEKAIGTSAETWLRMQMTFDLAQTRQRTDHIVVQRLFRNAPA
jgi:addiction module HigA family antidote